MKCKYNLGKYTCMVFLLLIVSSAVFANEEKNEYVLIINSYTESTPWSRIFTAPIYEQMVTDHDTWTAYTENMDVMLMESDEDVENFTNYLSHKYRDTPPSLVILLGNSAYGLLENELQRRWGNEISCLLCVEKDFLAPRDYYLSKKACPEELQTKLVDKTKESPNLSILYVPEYISETVGLMKKVKPTMNRLIFLADNRYVSAQNKIFIQQVMNEDYPDVKLELITAGDTNTDKLITILGNTDDRTCVLYYSWILLNQQGNRTIISSDVYRMLSSYTTAPVFTLNDMDIIENGMAGGFFYPASNISETLVNAIKDILLGKKLDDIIISGQPCPVLNYPILKQKNISVSGYGPTAIFYMKPPTFWEQYNLYICGAVIIIFIIILFVRIKTLNKLRVFQEKEIALMKNYSRLINSMPIGYMKQRVQYEGDRLVDYEIMEVNPEFEKLFRDKKDIIGKKGTDLSHPGLSQYMQTCSLVLNQNKKISIQYYYAPTDHYLNALIISSSTPGCVDIFMTDITELINTQQTLRTVNKKLSMSLDVANVISWKFDLLQQTIQCDVSKSFAELFDENQLTVSASLYFSKIHEEDRERLKDAYLSLILDQVDKIKEEYRIYKPQTGVDEFEWVEAYATVEKRDENNKPISLIGSMAIITDRKKAEEELLEAKNKAEESNRLKSAFLANMSHEIRTPLNAIVGFSNILVTTNDVEEREEYVQIIENNNTLLLQLINDILDLSKIEAGTLDFVYSDVNINSVLHELQIFMQKRITTDVELVFEQDNEDCLVFIAKSRFMQVVINLITNAIKFTEKGSIRFGYSIQEGNMLCVYVSDTGCGIPPEKQQNIFERFVKLNSFAQGTGLGLSICQMIVEYLGGKMWLESEVDKGSTFWFTFPYKAATLQVRKESYFEKKKVERENLVVLIAEDNVGNFKLFESILKDDYIIIHAWNGREAVELFKQYNPHIILMDINMPEMNGYEATQEIRKLSNDVPIIAVTAYAFASDEEQIMNNGFDAYTSKPLDAHALKSQMVNLLKSRILFL